MKIIIDDVLAEKNLRLLNLIILLLVLIQLIKLIFSFLSSYFFGLFSQEALWERWGNVFQVEKNKR